MDKKQAENSDEQGVIKDVFDAILGKANKDSIKAYQVRKDTNSEKVPKDITAEDFEYKYSYKAEQFLEGLIRSEIADNDDVVFILHNYRMIELSFNHIYTTFEGAACCSDKSRNVTQQLFNFYKTGETISFNSRAKYTFSHPKSVLKTHDSIIEFYLAVKNMAHGNPKKYIEAFGKLIIPKE